MKIILVLIFVFWKKQSVKRSEIIFNNRDSLVFFERGKLIEFMKVHPEVILNTSSDVIILRPEE
jgi:hypothetical protein